MSRQVPGRVRVLTFVAGLGALCLSCHAIHGPAAMQGPVRFGIVADCHYADIDPSGTRFYRQSLDKLSDCVATMNAAKVDFLVELGDLKDQDKSPAEEYTLLYLDWAEERLCRFAGPLYHVLGNHDMDSLSKQQVLARIRNAGGSRARPYYSFQVRTLHGIVLDANTRVDGVEYDHGNFSWTDTLIPAAELEWLRQDLAAARGPVVVFCHQLLDGTGSEFVKNAAAVRTILEESGKVTAVFQGHRHEGQVNRIHGIHYYTLKAVVEGDGPDNNSYAIVEVQPDRSMSVTGYRRAASLQLPAATTAAAN